MALSALPGVVGEAARVAPRVASRSSLRRRGGSVALRPRAVAAPPQSAPASGPVGLAPRPVASLTVGVPKETADGELRVAATPSSVEKLVKAGLKVVVEAGLGVGSGHADAAYAAAGATVGTRADALGCDVVRGATRRGGGGTTSGETRFLNPPARSLTLPHR